MWCRLWRGALLLATSRPYESSALIIALCTVLGTYFWRKRKHVSFGTILATLLSLSAALGVVLAYNHAVTGQALKMPYLLHMEQYGSAPTFWFMPSVAPRPFENDALRALSEEYEIPTYKSVSSLSAVGNIEQSMMNIFAVAIPGGGFLWLLPLIFVPLLRRDSEIRLFTLCATALLATLMAETYMSLHYMAPILVVGTLLAWLVIDRLWRFRKTRCSDRILLVGLLSVGLFGGPIWRVVHAIEGKPISQYRSDGFGFKRAQIVQKISKYPGKHVVFVHFTPQQNILHTWVANGANIDAERVVWAHDRGAENSDLQRYFKDRTFWYLEEKAGQISLIAYQPELASRPDPINAMQ